jgi:hypothetical protein
MTAEHCNRNHSLKHCFGCFVSTQKMPFDLCRMDQLILDTLEFQLVVELVQVHYYDFHHLIQSQQLKE